MRGEGHVHLGTIFDIPIGLHYSWVIIFILISVSLAQGVFPSCVPEKATWEYWALGIITAALFFVSVLIHEMAHSLVARANGMPVEGIDLFVFGGISKLEQEPRTPATEGKMAIVGPFTSFALAAIFHGISSIAQGTTTNVGCAASNLAVINVWLGAFNLVPAFPLDGGRVARSLLWNWLDDLRTATRIAASIGQLFGYVLIGIGVFSFFTGPGMGGIWLAFIGWFLLQAAQSGYQQLLVRESISGVRVSDIMRTDPIVIPAHASLQQAVDEYFLVQDATVFPVVRGEQLVGLLTVDDIREVPEAQWRTTTAGDVAEPADQTTVLSPDDEAEKALGKLRPRNQDVAVVEKDGRLAGILRQHDLLRHVRTRLQLGR